MSRKTLGAGHYDSCFIVNTTVHVQVRNHCLRMSLQKDQVRGNYIQRERETLSYYSISKRERERKKGKGLEKDFMFSISPKNKALSESEGWGRKEDRGRWKVAIVQTTDGELVHGK